MKVLLPSYRSIGWIVQAYAYLHEKYWGAPVVLIAEEDYSGGRFEFARPPDEIMVMKNGEIPASRFTDCLAWYMRKIEDEHVLIMLSDYLIYRPVDVDRLEQLQEYMAEHDILRGQVGDDTGFAYAGQKTDTYKDIDIWEGKFLATSLTPAVWSRKQLLDMMPLNHDSQAMEQKCKEAFYKGEYRSIAPAPGIMAYLNSLRGRDMTRIVLTEEVYNEVRQFIRISPGAFCPERTDLSSNWRPGDRS